MHLVEKPVESVNNSMNISFYSEIHVDYFNKIPNFLNKNIKREWEMPGEMLLFGDFCTDC